MVCLLAFTIQFVYNNNSEALDDGTGAQLGLISADISTKLYEASADSNTLLNVTSNTNPEISNLGSRDSVAVSFGAKGTATSYWESSKSLLGWVFSGTIGQVLLGVLGSIFTFLSVFYIWRFVRNGL